MAAEKEAQIHTAICAVMSDIKAVGKDKQNQEQKFAYRSIDAIYNELHSIMARHGVYNTAKVLSKERGEYISKSGSQWKTTSLTVEYTFWAKDGSNVATQAAGRGSDTSDKDESKAMAMAHKYALAQMFLIPTEDDDSDGASPEQSAPAKAKAAPAAAKPAPKATEAAKPAAAAKPALQAQEKKAYGKADADPKMCANFAANISSALKDCKSKDQVKLVLEKMKKNHEYLTPEKFQECYNAILGKVKEIEAITGGGAAS